MKKIFALVMTLCLLAGLMAVTATAEAAAVTVKLENSTASDISMTVEPGAAVYATSDDAKQFIKWTGTEAPADKFIKLELSADGATLTATLKNIDIDSSGTGYTAHAIEFPAGDYAVVVNVEGENKIQEQNAACIKYSNTKGMTITGAGSLSLNVGTAETTGAASGALWANGGDLLIKNTTIDFFVNSSSSAQHHAIYSSKGSVAFEGVKVTVKLQGGRLVFTGNGAEKVGRYTLDENPNRFVTIKDCNIEANLKTTLLETFTVTKISNTTLKATKSSSSGALFIPAPALEGEYTAIAGLAKNAENLDKLKVYDEKKLGSYTYFYMVPGIVDLLPTEPTTAPTEPAPEATTPEATTPNATTPEATTPEATTPEATIPNATTPKTETPDAEAPATTAPAADDATQEEGGNPLVVVLIVLVVLIVGAGVTFGVILYLKKKKA